MFSKGKGALRESNEFTHEQVLNDVHLSLALPLLVVRVVFIVIETALR